MFGDIAHGGILFMIGLYLCLKKTEGVNEFRYVVLMMGFFSCYCGLIYNDYYG
jgi:V-type H+-transporting ATPase subunit a